MKIKVVHQVINLLFRKRMLPFLLRLKERYALFSKGQRLIFLFSLISVVLFSGLFFLNAGEKIEKIPVDSFKTIESRLSSNSENQVQVTDLIKKIDQLTYRFQQMIREDGEHYRAVTLQLHTMQANIMQLASRQDLQNLSDKLWRDNPTLLNKVGHLQTTMQQIVQQHVRVQTVTSTQLEHYVHLVAVQGFSDGLRAILEVAGHPMALSVNDLCPVCHGWILKKLHYTAQTAEFEKQTALHLFRTSLQAK